MKNPNPVRIGVIGMGEHMMRAHVDFLTSNPNAELFSWFDPKPSDKTLELETIIGTTRVESEEGIFDEALLHQPFIPNKNSRFRKEPAVFCTMVIYEQNQRQY